MVIGHKRLVRRGGKNRTSFRFNTTDSIKLQNPSTTAVMDAVRKKSSTVSFEPLEECTIDPTGMIEKNGSRFSPYGFGRLCHALDVPKRFIERLSKDNADLTANVINDCVKHSGRGFLAAMDGNVVEGIVSDRYARLENEKVAEMASELLDTDHFSSLELQGLRMRLTHLGTDEHRGSSFFIPPEARGQYSVGDVLTNAPGTDDVLRGGLDIINGEDGGSAFNVAAYIWRLVCANGMVAPKEESLGRVVHRGGGLREKAMVLIQKSQDLCYNYLAKIPQANEIVLNNLEQKEFAGKVQKNFTLAFANSVLDRSAVEAELEDHPEDITLYNFFNAITFQAHGEVSIDKRRKIEVFGARVLDDGLKIAA